MNTKGLLRYSFVLAGLLILSACAGGGGPTVGNAAPSPVVVTKEAPVIPLSSADKLAEALVGTTWEGNVTIANCVNAPITLTFVDWAYNMDLMRVLAVSENCLVLQGGFLGSIFEGRLSVRSADKHRKIFLTPKPELGIAPGSIELDMKNGKTDITFYRVDS